MRVDLDSTHRALLLAIATSFEARSTPAWATGGFLRDALIGRTARDIDITTEGDPLVLGRGLAGVIDAHIVVLDATRKHMRLVLRSGDGYVDLVPLRAPDIESDLRLRDYTVDAIGGDVTQVASGEFDPLDPTGGTDDLRAGVVRAVSEQNLIDDPLRLLRGVRIATQLSFKIEGGTAALIRKYAPEIAQTSPERQRDEIMRIFGTERAGDGVRLLDSLGLFPHVLPEMEVARGVEQPKEHQHDVLGHSFAAVDWLDTLLSESEPEHPLSRELWHMLWQELGRYQGLRDHLAEEIVLGTTRRAVIKLCGLLHDIGKPATKSFQEDGRMRFFGHGDVGAELATSLMRRLRFSTREVGIVHRMIRAHLRPIQLGEQGLPSKRAIYKFFRDTGEAAIDTLFLSLADHLATVGPRLNVDGFRQHVALTSHILRIRYENEEVVAPRKLVSGDDLMANLGLEPGHTIGVLLEAVREAQAAGEVETREQGLDIARRRLDELRLPPDPSAVAERP